MPTWIHALLTILAAYAGFGFISHIGKVKFQNIFEKFLYILILLHLSSTAILHLYSIIFNSNDWIKIFPFWYSFMAIEYFAIFDLLQFQVELKIKTIKLCD